MVARAQATLTDSAVATVTVSDQNAAVGGFDGGFDAGFEKGGQVTLTINATRRTSLS